MAKRSPASKRASTKTSPLLNLLGVGFAIFAVGLACGYVVRSYAPLPFFPDDRLSPTAVSSKSSTENKIDRLEETLEDLDEKRAKTETELGETQIKAILGKS